MDPIAENYRKLFLEHGSGPAVGQWSEEGQRFRFEKLSEIADLSGASLLDLGCGLGDFYPHLAKTFEAVDYTGIDIVPEIVAAAQAAHPRGRFFCTNVLETGFEASFDYVMISGMFNNRRPRGTDFMKSMLSFAFDHCTKGIGFNFTSTYVNFMDETMQYHDPVEILQYCLDHLTRKVSMHHHYNRCDVAVFAYR